MKEIKVADNEAGRWLDKPLGKYLNLAGKGFIYKMLRKKNITLNGKKCDGTERLEAGTRSGCSSPTRLSANFHRFLCRR